MSTGHPRGLYPLFFTEMWERLSFYLLMGILLLYTTDTELGGFGFSDRHGNEIVGTYMAFVYFTPFLGGLIADRYLGYRLAVLLGGLLMSAGLFLVGTPALGVNGLYGGLALLCFGNGFFKPNISVMVGNLYEKGDPRRDAGFNIFYMGINVGAFVANLAAAWIRNEFGWGWAFRGAGIGILVGLVILLAHWKLLERADRRAPASPDDLSVGRIFLTILVPAGLVGFGAWWLVEHHLTWFPVSSIMTGFLAGMLPIFYFFGRTAATAAPEEKPGLFALVPIFAAGATFFMILHLNSTALTQWARDNTDRHSANVFDLLPRTTTDALPSYYGNAAPDLPRPDERMLVVVEPVEARKFGANRMDESAVKAVLARQATLRAVPEEQVAADQANRPYLVRRVVNVYADADVRVGDDGKQVAIEDGARPVRKIAFAREAEGRTFGVLLVDQATFETVYAKASGKRLPPGEFVPVTNPEVFQSSNPFFVIAFTPLVVMFFQWLVRRGRGISTANKILYGVLLTAAAMLVMTLGGVASAAGTVKVSTWWLIGAYAVVTVGELCISPMGLSLVTKLSPKRLVGLMMGCWFVSTAFGNKLSGFFGGLQKQIADPMHFFLILAGSVLVVALGIYLVLPRLDAALKKYGA